MSREVITHRNRRPLRVAGVISALAFLTALAAVLEIRRLLNELLEVW